MLRLSTVALTTALFVGEVAAGPMDSCSNQLACIDVDVTKTDPTSKCDGSNEPCEWTVCLTLNLNKPGCGKSGTVSHTCVKDANTCLSSNGFFSAAEDGSISSGHEQCQTGIAGSTLQFLLKDGGSCSGSASYDGLNGGSSLTCQPRPGTIPSCTGNDVGKECVWSIVLPDCPPPPPTPQCSCPNAPIVQQGPGLSPPTTPVLVTTYDGSSLPLSPASTPTVLPYDGLQSFLKTPYMYYYEGLSALAVGDNIKLTCECSEGCTFYFFSYNCATCLSSNGGGFSSMSIFGDWEARCQGPRLEQAPSDFWHPSLLMRYQTTGPDVITTADATSDAEYYGIFAMNNCGNDDSWCTTPPPSAKGYSGPQLCPQNCLV